MRGEACQPRLWPQRIWRNARHNLRQDRVAFHFTWAHDWPGVSAVLALIEARITPYEARPHWGKLFTQDAAYIRSLYPKRPEFVALARDLDPTGKFRNDFLVRYVFGEE